MKRITLLYPHRHAGVDHASGVTLTVPDNAADWLLDHRIAILSRNQRTPAAPDHSATAARPATGGPAAGTDEAPAAPPSSPPQSADSVTNGDDHEPAR